ncbi:MAG: hypothetical protein O7A08_07220 [SAR324 cluster bacterium]|nr:hypothetical protein [SAR324 cluster bacterium]
MFIHNAMVRHGRRRPPWVVTVVLLAAVCFSPEVAPAQEANEQEDHNIFNRFVLRREEPKNWQALIEFPVFLRPQSQPNAKVIKNLGLNYVSTFRPQSRWYLSRSIGFARMEWIPDNTAVSRVKVRTFQTLILLNRLAAHWLVISFGIGLGIMDGLVEFKDRRVFNERLEPFVPFQFGLAARVGQTLQLGLKISHFPFFKTGPAISTTRVLLGIGYNY